MYTHETDLPTQQKEKSEQMRLSQPHEDSCRKGSDQPPSPTGKKASHYCLKCRRFPKAARILKRSHYQTVSKHQAKWLGRALLIDYRQGHSPCAKLGLTVSRRFGKAHERNRFKRLVREAFRHLYPHFPSDLEINILPRNNPRRLNAILSDLKQFLAMLSKT